MKSYAQNGEDLVLWKYFQDKGISEGTFLDVGANDGVTLSNTYLFALAGWKGHHVEPGLPAYKKLCENIIPLNDSGNFIFYCVAIAEKAGYQTLHASGEHLGKGDTGLLSTLIPSEMARWKGTETFTEETVRTCRIEDLGIEGPIDLISIDCEGMDLEVLFQVPIEDWKVKSICIEFNQDKTLKAEIRHYLLRKRFRQIHENFENLIFVK